MTSSNSESENAENLDDRAPMWFARLNQGCLILVALALALVGLGYATRALSLADRPEKIMLLAVGMGTAVAAVAICWKVMQKKTLELLRKKWTTFIDFTGI